MNIGPLPASLQDRREVRTAAGNLPWKHAHQGRAQTRPFARLGTEIAKTICHRLAGGESLRAICTDPATPARATVFRWLDRNEEFRRRYALARECLIEDLFDELREIAADRSEPIKAPIYRGTCSDNRNHLIRQRS